MTWILGALALAFIVFWFIWLSPFRYTPSETTLAIDEAATHRVFVFGTLRNKFVRTLVTRSWIAGTPARLPGYRRTGLDLTPDPDAMTEGELLYVTPLQLRRLDRYERVGTRYERFLYPLDDGSMAWVYRRMPNSRKED